MRTLLLSSMARMTRDTAPATAAAAPTPKAPKTVADDMPARRVFESIAEAVAYLTLCAETYSDFASIPFAGVGVIEDAEGAPTLDTAIYTDQMDVMISKLRKDKNGTQTGTIKAIVLAPVPKISVLADPANPSVREWLTRILHKELNHVAVRQLRTAENVASVVETIPTTIDGYISSARDSSGIMESFNDLYKQISDLIASKSPAWKKAKLGKADLKRSFESKGYASEIYPALEDRPADKGGSLFVMGLQVGIAAAKKKGLDPTIFERWLATREAAKFEPGAEAEEEDFDLGDLTSALLAEPATESKESEPAPAA